VESSKPFLQVQGKDKDAHSQLPQHNVESPCQGTQAKKKAMGDIQIVKAEINLSLLAGNIISSAETRVDCQDLW
jgi:hypothetical protein